MTSREATHAGSWYSNSKSTLSKQLDGWLSAVDGTSGEPPAFQAPIPNCRALIAPHAGYSYSGPTAAWAYKAIDTTNIKRVFVLGPSHHFYLSGCALSRCNLYETPIGDLPIDKSIIDELAKTGEFDDMSLDTDEAEHSIEMHLPYVRKIFEGKDITVIPILVGSLSVAKEKSYGKLLAPYLADPANFFVISSDFCHWGSRFSYTYYRPSPTSSFTKLSRSAQPSGDPIHSSIEALDREGMSHISLSPSKSASSAHDQFAAYLSETRNTICGRHPIGLLLGCISALQDAKTLGWDKESVELRWTKYAQSSAVTHPSDSSVSYASAFLKAGN